MNSAMQMRSAFDQDLIEILRGLSQYFDVLVGLLALAVTLAIVKLGWALFPRLRGVGKCGQIMRWPWPLILLDSLFSIWNKPLES